MDTTPSQPVLQGKKKGEKKRNHNHAIDKESCFATRKDRQTETHVDTGCRGHRKNEKGL
jgi:hypothetical protein